MVSNGPKRTLSLLDGVCIIVGTIIGAGIFKAAPDIAGFAGSFEVLIGLWLLGGLITVIGALCFAELASRFSDVPGGDYGFLKLAYGKPVGFMFAWATFWIVRPGNIGAMALTFATYFDRLLGFDPTEDLSTNRQAWYAIAAVILLSSSSLVGLKQAKWIQNLLTFAKVGGIVLIGMLAFFSPASQGFDFSASNSVSTDAAEGTTWLLAMVFIMFSFGGWNDLSFVSTEIKHPERNLFRSLVIGSVAVTAIYIVINIAFVFGIGFDAVRNSPAVATDVVSRALGVDSWIGSRGSQIISGLICISCLGAINGIIITSPRIYYAAGRDFKLLHALGKWNHERDQPWLATAVQALVTIGLFCLCFRYENPFGVIVVVSAPFFWTFLGLAGISLIVLRKKFPDQTSKAVFRTPFFPFEPVVLAIACFLMTFASIQHLISEKVWVAVGVVVTMMVIGIGLGLILRGSDDSRPD